MLKNNLEIFKTQKKIDGYNNEFSVNEPKLEYKK